MTDTPKTFEEHLFRAARRILHPLVRILLRNGITAPVFQELARKVFVDVARDEFPPEGKSQTLANISVITGLNRKEVARLAKEDEFGDGDKINKSSKLPVRTTNTRTFHKRQIQGETGIRLKGHIG